MPTQPAYYAFLPALFLAQLSATASEPGPAGLQRVMSAMQGTAMLCVLRVAGKHWRADHTGCHCSTLYLLQSCLLR